MALMVTDGVTAASNIPMKTEFLRSVGQKFGRIPWHTYIERPLEKIISEAQRYDGYVTYMRWNKF